MLGAYLVARAQGPAASRPCWTPWPPGFWWPRASAGWATGSTPSCSAGPTTLPWALEIAPQYRPPGFEQYATFHPTFLYEMLWNLRHGRASLIWADRRFRLGHGKVFALYVLLYCAGRFWIEALRIDQVNEVGGFRLNNYTSLIVLRRGPVWLLWLVRHRPGREAVVEGPESPSAGGDRRDVDGRAGRRRIDEPDR